ncbi:MAG: cytochrome c biogenesis CcdA family protein [Candidatus Hydrothermarchaeales archaeon]
MVELTESEKKLRIYLVGAFFILFTIFLIGILWLTRNPMETVTYTLSYAAGLSMIVLPCTFPLVFIIVPLSMGEGYKKGLSMALLFSLGLIITLALYGVFVAWGGQIFGLKRITTIMYLIAGSLAWVFGLAELGLISLKIPTYGGATPQFITRQGDYLKALFLGLFLGNAGLACPNPATYVILTYIAASESLVYGAAMQAVNGIGRTVPLIALSILGILGVNATNALVRRKDMIEKWMGWGLVFVGAFIIVFGLFGHLWFLNTPVHAGWTRWFGRTVGTGAAEYECCVEPPCMECLRTDHCGEVGKCICRAHVEEGELEKVCNECKIGLAQGKGIIEMVEKTQNPAFATLVGLIVLPIGWYYLKNRGSEEEDN